MTLFGLARLAREATSDQPRVYCHPPRADRSHTVESLAFMASQSVTNSRPYATSTAANSTPPMSLQHRYLLSVTHAPPCQDRIVSRSTCSCLRLSRSAIATIFVKTSLRGKPSRRYEHDCRFSVQLPPSPTASCIPLSSRSRSST